MMRTKSLGERGGTLAEERYRICRQSQVSPSGHLRDRWRFNDKRSDKRDPGEPLSPGFSIRRSLRGIAAATTSLGRGPLPTHTRWMWLNRRRSRREVKTLGHGHAGATGRVGGYSPNPVS